MYLVIEMGRYPVKENGYSFRKQRSAIEFAQTAAKSGTSVYVWDCTNNRAILKIYDRRVGNWA